MEEQDYKTIARSRLTDRHRSDDTFLAILDTAIEIKEQRQAQYLEIASKLLDIDESTGKNLDLIGKLIGEERTLVNFIDRPYFGFMGARLAESYDVGYWYSLYKNKYGTLRTLTDEEYRRVLKARVVKNSSDSNRNSFLEVLNTLLDNNSAVIVESENNTAIEVRMKDEDGLASYYLSKYKSDTNLIPLPLGRRISLNYVESFSAPYNVSLLYRTSLIESNSTEWKYLSVSDTDTTNYLNVDKSNWAIGMSPFGDRDFNSPSANGFPNKPATIIQQQTILWVETTIFINDNSSNFVFESYLDNGATLWVNGVQVLEDYNANAHYFTTEISNTYFNIGSNTITIKCVDDRLGLRPNNWIWFDFRVKSNTENVSSLVINWKLDGDADEQRYYCSETPFTAETKPAPKAVLDGGVRTCTDTAIEVGKTYYVAVGAVKNGIEKLSEIKPFDALIDDVDLLIFADSPTFPSTNIVDSSKFSRAITKQGNISIINTIDKLYDDGWIYFDGVNDNLSASISQLGTSDFTFECFIVQDLVNSKSYGRLMQIGKNNALGSILLYRQDVSNPATLTVALGNGSDYYYAVVGTKTLQNSIPNHICLMRKSGIFYLFINGDLDGSNNSHQTFSISNNPIFIGSNTDGIEEFSGYFSSIRLTKFARYNTSGFTPPQFKFLKP